MEVSILHTAYVTQTTTERDGKTEWIVFDKDQKIIGRLDKNLDERQAMAFLHFARPFETAAFNRGSEFQKTLIPQTIRTLQSMVKNFEGEREVMRKRNIELANELEKLNLELDKLTIKT